MMHRRCPNCQAEINPAQRTRLRQMVRPKRWPAAPAAPAEAQAMDVDDDGSPSMPAVRNQLTSTFGGRFDTPYGTPYGTKLAALWKQCTRFLALESTSDVLFVNPNRFATYFYDVAPMDVRLDSEAEEALFDTSSASPNVGSAHVYYLRLVKYTQDDRSLYMMHFMARRPREDGVDESNYTSAVAYFQAAQGSESVVSLNANHFPHFCINWTTMSPTFVNMFGTSLALPPPWLVTPTIDNQRGAYADRPENVWFRRIPNGRTLEVLEINPPPMFAGWEACLVDMIRLDAFQRFEKPDFVTEIKLRQIDQVTAINGVTTSSEPLTPSAIPMVASLYDLEFDAASVSRLRDTTTVSLVATTMLFLDKDQTVTTTNLRINCDAIEFLNSGLSDGRPVIFHAFDVKIDTDAINGMTLANRLMQTSTAFLDTPRMQFRSAKIIELKVDFIKNNERFNEFYVSTWSFLINELGRYDVDPTSAEWYLLTLRSDTPYVRDNDLLTRINNARVKDAFSQANLLYLGEPPTELQLSRNLRLEIENLLIGMGDLHRLRHFYFDNAKLTGVHLTNDWDNPDVLLPRAKAVSLYRPKWLYTATASRPSEPSMILDFASETTSFGLYGPLEYAIRVLPRSDRVRPIDRLVLRCMEPDSLLTNILLNNTTTTGSQPILIRQLTFWGPNAPTATNAFPLLNSFIVNNMPRLVYNPSMNFQDLQNIAVQFTGRSSFKFPYEWKPMSHRISPGNGAGLQRAWRDLTEMTGPRTPASSGAGGSGYGDRSGEAPLANSLSPINPLSPFSPISPDAPGEAGPSGYSPTSPQYSPEHDSDDELPVGSDDHRSQRQRIQAEARRMLLED